MQRLAGIRRRENNARRLRLSFFQRINKVTGPWHALCCFAAHVETKSPPVSSVKTDFRSLCWRGQPNVQNCRFAFIIPYRGQLHEFKCQCVNCRAMRAFGGHKIPGECRDSSIPAEFSFRRCAGLKVGGCQIGNTRFVADFADGVGFNGGLPARA